jgi:hypothetical protein
MKTRADAATARCLADQEGNLLYFHMRISILASPSNAEDAYRGWAIRLFCFAALVLLLFISLFYHKDKANWKEGTVYGIHLPLIFGIIGIFWCDDFKSKIVKKFWNFLALRSYTFVGRRYAAESGLQPHDRESEQLLPKPRNDDS